MTPTQYEELITKLNYLITEINKIKFHLEAGL